MRDLVFQRDVLALIAPDKPPSIMQGLICHKVGMSRVFLDNGDAVPVTYLKVEPNTVVRTKSEDKDGYNAVVLGVGGKKWKTRKGKEYTRYSKQKEWKVENLEGVKAGTEIKSDVIPEGSTVSITGISKGKGFQGVIRRHGMSRGPETHGSHHHRRPGSVGMCEYPGHILKGKKMPGRMGNDQVTLHGRTILVSDPDEGIVGVKGPVPGPNGAAVFVTVEELPEGGEASAKEEVKEEKVEEKVEEPKEEEKKEEEKPEEAKEESDSPEEK